MIAARAMARAEWVILGVAGASIGLGAVAIAPSMLSASDAEAPAELTPADPVLADACTSMRTLFEHAEGVIRVWDGAEHGGAQLLLWYRDDHDTGEINADEVMLITHNESLRTLAAYAYDTAEDHGASAALRRSSIGDRFPWRWRAREGMGRTIVAHGATSFGFERVREAASTPSWRITVAWGGHESESEDVCTFVVVDG